MATPDRIRLSDSFQHKLFFTALRACLDNKDSLTDFEYKFVQQMSDGYDIAADNMTLTVKQFNFLRQIAFEVSQR